MIGVMGTSARALAAASALACQGTQTLLYCADDELLDEIRAGELLVSEKGLPAQIKKAEESGKLKFTRNARRFSECTLVLISAQLVRSEELEEALKFFVQSLQAVLLKATESLDLVIIDPLPAGSMDYLTDCLERMSVTGKSSGIFGVLGEDIQEEDLKRVRVNAPFSEETPSGELRISLSLSPVPVREGLLAAWYKRPKTAVIGALDARAEGKLREMYRNLRVPKRGILSAAPKELEYAFAMKAAWQVIESVFTGDLAATGACNLFYAMTAQDKPAGLSLGLDGTTLDDAEMLSQGLELPLLEGALEAASEQTAAIAYGIVTQLLFACSDEDDRLENVQIAVLGAAQKSGSGDMRGAPVLALLSEITSLGADVRLYMPEGYSDLRWRLREAGPKISYAKSFVKAAAGADVLLVLGQPGLSVDLKRTAAAMKQGFSGRPMLCDPFGVFEGRANLDLFEII